MSPTIRRAQLRRAVALLGVATFALVLWVAGAWRTDALATLPAGFTDSVFASGFGGRLTTMTFAPDGRLFVSEKQGAIRIVKDGVLLPDAFLTVATATDNEKGLKGIEFDPSYATNGFVYVYYTDPATLKNNVSRFTVKATDPNAADPASEVVLIDGIDSGIYHSAGAIHFGPDGKLYVSTGDASYGPNSQNQGNLNGKILRLNTDGSIPADNPFVGQAGKRAEIWAYGLRNPFTFAFDPASTRMYINDVGDTTWEELDQGAVGANFGWATCEGMCHDARFVDPLYTYNHADGPGKSITGAAFYRASMFPAQYNGAYFFGDYVGNYLKRYDPATGTVTDFATNAANPVDLDVGPDGALYYLSVESKKIDRIAYSDPTTPTPTPTPTPLTSNLFQNGGFENSGASWLAPSRSTVRAPAQATVNRDTSVFSSGSASARIDVTTAGGPTNAYDWYVQLLQPNIRLTAGIPHTLTFAARASTDRWIRFAFSQNSAPYPVYLQQSVAVSTAWNTYSVTFTPTTDDPKALFNFNFGDKTGQIWLDDLSLSAPPIKGHAPLPKISLPANGATYRAGDTISFSGSATDAEDGSIPASGLTWEVLFHHDTHTHPALEPTTGVASGSFVIPDTGEVSSNTWYRIHLTAVDSDGNKSEVTRDITPLKAKVALATQPSGLSLTLDGIPVTAPYTFTGVVNFKREIAAPPTQTLNGVNYQFASWSDSGAATHTISTPGSDTTYTAIYRAIDGNSFANGGFDAPGNGWATPWRISVRSPAAATLARDSASFAEGSAAARIDVTTAAPSATYDWYVQVIQPNIALTGSVPNTFSFWAKAATARTIGVSFQRNSAPYPVYFATKIAIGTDWARYTVTFTPSADDPKAIFAFNLGTNSGSVWIDSVSLTH